MSAWPKWINKDERENLREVAPNVFVGAEYATLSPPGGKPWELVIDFYGSDLRWPSRTKTTAKKALAIPFLDGDNFPAGALTTTVRAVREARKRGPVLIHCQAGLSRSASAAYAFLRRVSRVPHAEALRRVKVCAGFPRTETLGSARSWVETGR